MSRLNNPQRAQNKQIQPAPTNTTKTADSHKSSSYRIHIHIIAPTHLQIQLAMTLISRVCNLLSLSTVSLIINPLVSRPRSIIRSPTLLRFRKWDVSGWRLELFAHEVHSIGLFDIVTAVTDVLHAIWIVHVSCWVGGRELQGWKGIGLSDAIPAGGIEFSRARTRARGEGC